MRVNSSTCARPEDARRSPAWFWPVSVAVDYRTLEFRLESYAIELDVILIHARSRGGYECSPADLPEHNEICALPLDGVPVSLPEDLGLRVEVHGIIALCSTPWSRPELRRLSEGSRRAVPNLKQSHEVSKSRIALRRPLISANIRRTFLLPQVDKCPPWFTRKAHAAAGHRPSVRNSCDMRRGVAFGSGSSAPWCGIASWRRGRPVRHG
jgi:hypothetical protein